MEEEIFLVSEAMESYSEDTNNNVPAIIGNNGYNLQDNSG